MFLLQSIGLGLIKSFNFCGRSSRAEYLPFLMAAILALGGILFWGASVYRGEDFWVFALIAVAAFYLPVTSAGVRRLHDAGYSGSLILLPWMPPLAAYALYLSLTVIFSPSYDLGVVLSLAFVISLVQFPEFLVALLSILGAITALWSLYFVADAGGKLLLASSPDGAHFGAEPHSVSEEYHLRIEELSELFGAVRSYLWWNK